MVQGTEVIPCPPCPKDPWVVLATLTFQTGTDGAPAAANAFSIDCRKDRRILVSAARAQAQLIQFCDGDF